ncbi:MAG TPA: ABC transporter permease, partial [Candidatus Acidoferrum sp.]|nr:ABC transporter permease [Candidatus Acidoferrum sp.]
MRPADACLVALENLREHKLRTWLTMLGMMFGVGAVIAMLSIGAGAEREALALIERLGIHNVVVRAVEFKPEELAEIRKKSLGLSPRDAEAIREAVPGVRFIAPVLDVKPYKIISAGAKTEAGVVGVSHRQAALAHLAMAEGRFFDARDEAHHAQVCVIGMGVRRDLFGTEAAVGRDIKVNDVWLEVVGVLAAESIGKTQVQGVQVASTEREIYLPYTTGLRKFERDPLRSPLAELVVALDDDAPARETGAAAATLLDRLHGGARDYDIVVPEALLEQSRATQRLF